MACFDNGKASAGDGLSVPFELQARLLEWVATGRPLQEVLDEACLLVERLHGSGACSILLLDRKHNVLRRGAGPSLPDAALDALDGLVLGETSGSCGTAAFTAAPVMVTDTHSDPRWAADAFQTFAAQFGVGACWSMPYFDREQRVLGTLAISHTSACAPPKASVELLKAATHLVGIAVERQQADAELHEANEELERRVAQRTLELEEANRERLRVEVELRHAQKLKAVGQLASGLAHEINTPMQYVEDSLRVLEMASTSLIDTVQVYRGQLRSLGPVASRGAEEVARRERESNVHALAAEVPAALQRCFEGTRRVTELVRAMRDFGHRGEVEPSPQDINRAVTNAVTLAASTTRGVAEVEVELAQLPAVSCSLSDIHQVVLNLLVNAAHAVEDAGGNGHITVRSRQCEGGVEVEVEDDGVGIAPELRERIFEPFFTTKEVGRGTGQGLTIAYHLITDRHHGRLTCEPAESGGSRFLVWLPLGTQDEPALAEAAP